MLANTFTPGQIAQVVKFLMDPDLEGVCATVIPRFRPLHATPQAVVHLIGYGSMEKH